MTIKLIISCCLLRTMIVLKESTDYLESKKDSFGSEINDLNNKISSSQKRLDELRKEKYNIDFQSDETNKRADSIKKDMDSL